MKKQFFSLSLLSALLAVTGCKQQTGEAKPHIPTAPQMEARVDRSEPVKIVDIEQAFQKPEQLKLSQIASEIEYYTLAMPAIPSPKRSKYRTATRLSPSTIRVSTTGSRVFQANDTASRH